MLKTNEIMEAMNNKRVMHAVDGYTIGKMNYTAESIKEVLFFKNMQEFTEWCDVLLKIHGENTPIIVRAIHKLS